MTYGNIELSRAHVATSIGSLYDHLLARHCRAGEGQFVTLTALRAARGHGREAIG